MTANKREIIYIDVEDEITSVIDKVVSAKSGIIGLVPPKRAAMLQSIVNMKLLKRSADQADKKIVLVTSEASLMPLAAMSKIHVAKNLQSKPYVPALETVSKKADLEAEPEVAAEEVAVTGGLSAATDTAEQVEDVPSEAAVKNAKETKSSAKPKKDKKFGPSIPNFDSFRSKILLGVGGVIVLVGGWFVLYQILPKSSVSIKADTSQINIAETMSVQPGLKDDDIGKATLQATSKQVIKTLTQTFTPTGQKNVGEKAKGTATLVNCNKEDKLSDTTITVPAGVTLRNGDKLFVTSAAVDVAPSSYSGNTCQANKPSAAVDVVAQSSGDQYNLSGRSYSVDGYGSVTATGSQMSGGTTKNLTVVSDEDVTQAKAKIAAQDTTDVKNDLKKLIGGEYTLLEDSFANTAGATTVNPAVGAEASSATLTIDTTFSQVGIKTSSFKKFMLDRAQKHFDTNSQKVYDDGIKTAALKTVKKVSDTNYEVSVNAQVFVGPQIDDGKLAKQISGKRVGEAEEIIRKTPGVRDVKVRLSPFYVTSLPKAGRITISYDVQSSKPIQ